MTETMGQIIKRLRKERNLTQEELAEQLNITAPAVSKWENDAGMPDISHHDAPPYICHNSLVAFFR